MSKYQVMPPLTGDQLAALREPVREHGVQVPVDVDESGEILDGHNRSAVCAGLGIECPQRVITGLTEDQKTDYAWRANTTRRQLDPLTRRRMALEMHGQGMPQQRIAARLGVSQSAVGRYVAGADRGRARSADGSARLTRPRPQRRLQPHRQTPPRLLMASSAPRRPHPEHYRWCRTTAFTAAATARVSPTWPGCGSSSRRRTRA